MRNDAFAGYHPAINFLFFVGAVALGVFFTHPAFLAISLFAAALYYLLLRGAKGLKPMLGMLLLLPALALINPLLNTRGDTVLFWVFGTRPFTWEALCYGLVTGAMFVSVLLWFSCYQQVMTSDKFIYLFGRCIPAISLLLSMVLRLVPNFQKKAQTIIGARKCVGKSPENGTRREKLLHSMDVLSVLTTWSLEGAVMTADSMGSRGYGSGNRSNYSLYRLTARDKVAAAVIAAGIALTVFSAALGGTAVTYFPQLVLPKLSGITWLGCCGYGALLLLPSILHIWEEAT